MYSNITANKRKTYLLLVLFVVVYAGIAWLLAKFLNVNNTGSLYVVGFAFLYVVFSYYLSSRVALAMVGGKQIAKKDNPELYRIVENLAITEGLPTPKIYIINDQALNAFATGRDPSHASVAVTSGLLGALDKKELEGVMAHELGHIKNYDIRVALIAFALVAGIGLISDLILRASWFVDDDDSRASLLLGIAIAILAPIIAMFIQLAISRQREFLADSTGALTTRYPEGLASALRKIEQQGSVLKKQSQSTAHFFFANPLKKGGLSKLLSTHPPTEERINRLEKMKDSL